MDEFSCRVCGYDNGDSVILDLGDLYLSGFTTTINGEFNKYPLKLVECAKCHVVQLLDNVPLDSMYRQYWYRSGLNPSMVNDLKDIVFNVERRVELHDRDIVIDIGCNDGTLFDSYNNDLIKIGFDPALNVGNCNNNCTYFVNDYFPTTREKVPEVLNFAKAKVITAIAMFYDLPDPNKFLKSVVEYLDDDGLFVVQLTDLLSMYLISAFDNICHEHLEYYRLLDLDFLFRMNGLTIVDAEYNDVNGGSLRVYAIHTSSVDESHKENLWEVKMLIENESEILADWPCRFINVIVDIYETVRKFLEKELCSNKRICGLGASTKGNTLLQVLNLDTNYIESIGEINKDKFSLFTVGSWIPIVPEEDLLKNPPDYFFILPWHFVDTFTSNFKDYVKKGGRLVFPLPRPRVYMYENGKFVWRSLKRLLES